MKVWPMYRIREVDAPDDEIADTLADLHRLTFFDGAAIPEFDWGHWWLAYLERMPVAFAGGKHENDHGAKPPLKSAGLEGRSCQEETTGRQDHQHRSKT